MPSSEARPSLRPRAVLLDFGGTLVRPLADMGPIYHEAAARTGVDVHWDRFLKEVRRSWDELWPTAAHLVGKRPSLLDLVHRRALERVGATGPVAKMVRDVRDLAVNPRQHPPFVESDEVLRALLGRGYSVHLLSNNTDWLPQIVQGLGWAGRFATVTYSQEVGAEKPDRRLFELALQRAECLPSEAVHVGDLWVADYQGARAAGIPSLWLNRSGLPPPGPCTMLRDLRGLLPLLPPRDRASETKPTHRRRTRART